SCCWCSEVACQVPTRHGSMAAAALGPGPVLVLSATGVPPPFPDRASATTTIAPIRTTTSALAAIRMSVSGLRPCCCAGYPGVPETGGPENGYGAALVWLGHGAPL